jgi:hypothetical protein
MSKEAMKLALESLQDAVLDYSMGKGAVMRHTEAIKALEEALAKQEQGEPVAWLEGETIYWKEDQGLNDWIRKNGKPLYTIPQQRTWVGLTDEDLAVCGDEDDVMLARYWERVLKEKNT